MTDSPYTVEKMQERFATVKAKIERIEHTSPRVVRDLHYSKLTIEQLNDYKISIKIHEAGLAELRTEYAMLAKSLGGRVLEAR